MFYRRKLLNEIQAKREMMIQSADKHGISSEITIRHSQELDKLILEYQYNLQRQKERRIEIRLLFKQLILNLKKPAV
ncbi:aspartyl-phosphate phosphatase Spo0E family protein [Cytobacillus gottheilii]|uniref:Aspartyl-phosphate phosphatase Spo0E family protein n=1 Tax=Cytobacillus gottheilii TaxID=859144 RepID=A0ABX8FGD8_9BACI|nr:aspartyl-phosphate phosphatase Spo0E family protein [Cytobacillus gottheilii]